MDINTSVEAGVRPYSIDKAHSQIGFVARYMGFSKVRGRFKDVEGRIHVDPSQISTLEADIMIHARSIVTHDETRDKHLRTNDFLAVDEHPQITFKSTSVEDVNAQSFTLIGDLTIRGVTRQVEIAGTYLGEGADPWGGTRVGFEGRTRINRKDYGVNWNAALEAGGFLVGDEIEIVLDIQAMEMSDEDAE